MLSFKMSDSLWGHHEHSSHPVATLGQLHTGTYCMLHIGMHCMLHTLVHIVCTWTHNICKHVCEIVADNLPCGTAETKETLENIVQVQLCI